MTTKTRSATSKPARTATEVLPAGSWASSIGSRRSMQSNRPRNTRIEVQLRRSLHERGLRFRKHLRPVQGLRCEADVAFPGLKIAVFVDGCFWHACPDHRSMPVTNGEWWEAKLRANVARDRENERLLTLAGWTVLRLWEHQSVATMTEAVVSSVRARRLQKELAGRVRR